MSALLELLIKLLDRLLKNTQVSHKRRRRTTLMQACINGAVTAFLAFEIVLLTLLVAYYIVRIP